MCMYALYVYVHVLNYACVCVRVCFRCCICVCMYVLCVMCVYVCVCMCMYVCIYVCDLLHISIKAGSQYYDAGCCVASRQF